VGLLQASVYLVRGKSLHHSTWFQVCFVE